MKKIRLDLNALGVESFDTVPAADSRGTLLGHEIQNSQINACLPPSGSMDPFLDTCQYATCAGDTCQLSCNGTCNCGSAGCVPLTAGYTYCPKDASCVNLCHPTP